MRKANWMRERRTGSINAPRWYASTVPVSTVARTARDAKRNSASCVERAWFPGNDEGVARRKGLLERLVQLRVQPRPATLGLGNNTLYAQAAAPAQGEMPFDVLSLAQSEERRAERGGHGHMT